MTSHLAPFQARTVRPLTTKVQQGWQMKRYAILAQGRSLSDDVVAAATAEGFRRLPAPGTLADDAGNHGVGFQIIHFAETAVVSPLFYWQWGSVLAQADQIRASWDAPTHFDDGAEDVVGCVWEMNLITHETDAWAQTLLSAAGTPDERLSRYLERHA